MTGIGVDDGDLVIGTASGKWYAAEVDIPAREYDEQEYEILDGEKGFKMVALPLDMDKVVLTLWSIDEKVKVEEV